MSYPNTKLYIGGQWQDATDGKTLDVTNPVNGEVIGTVAHASHSDLEAAVAAAVTGFKQWSQTSAFERYKVIRKAAILLRERLEEAAHLLTTDEGKPLTESRMEVNSCADLLDWFAEEGRRTYGRIIPARSVTVQQYAVKEPVGPAVGFTPWNFPMSQIVRKLGPAVSAGCSIIIKGPEEAPAAPAFLFRCLHDAGIPAGVVGLLFGSPAEISEYLIPHPVIRKVSFTGSIPVGKQLAGLAGLHMKRVTMELGGHAPVIIADDANIEAATTALVGSKFRNAGQVCISPTRFLIQSKVHDQFVETFVKKAGAFKVGDGLVEGTQMGPLINERRRAAVESLIEDAVGKGAKIATGGERIGNSGYFFQPTVLTGVTTDMRAMNEEPFGPIALVRSFGELDEAIEEAGRLPFGLGSYAWTSSAVTARRLAQGVQAGMLSINHIGLGLPETPYGGVRESGYGYEGGSEALEAYMNTRFITHDQI
ncbi:NAD-dependent succinate-semialdehyde dehydrogenase [Rhizobium pusense]|uniref:NAD-dependent succinate-semialdehyde dehydrogenase n=1 Tax=Agrobacterium pusense TaxID=648995 RepID=A0A6H0ZG65_9HYPH|nr:NAD-dependent succinate-semialdehyde dehydrogenase [Agrobacterium pusense]MDH2092337.1 NAD-dependent succinate-semialdehyde dehydrogenase [Agrobacterium pusense]QIX19838.1 NAD-dependent succinate-semialdehyde dehydrogenase [Agrobacterium pusense]WCK27620.1 NAD-dependent succinate-semialdehyde dehydrogenase [Agrobacterium pusense]